jgi:hypothetical protein
MNIHADKTRENRSQSVANNLSQKNSDSESTFQFVDNRPEAIAQRKLQDMANNSPQGSQLKAYQDMDNTGQKNKQAAQLPTVQLMMNGGDQQQGQQQGQPQIQIVAGWHYGFEVWAQQAGIVDPQGRLGFVPHYNVRIGNGPIQHVYVNAYGVQQIVPIGGRPDGY